MTLADRLKPYTVAHELIHLLRPYEASEVGLMFRNATWGTLVYWSQLLDRLEEPAHEMA